MTDRDKAHTAILLPAAHVTLFTHDAGSRDALTALRDDWRFARVTLDVVEGDVETAINFYKTTASPDLIIIQTENIDEGFSPRLEELSAYCQDGTNAIVVGPVNDVNLYRRLVSMGVSDYLVKPLKSAQLGEDIASTLLEKLGASESRLIAFIGSKGGAGATTMSEGLAWALADRYGQKTFLMDAAGGWSSLSVGIGFEPSTTLAEAVRAASENNEDSLTRMVHQAHERLFILSSGGDVLLDDLVASEGYETLVDHMMAIYPVVIIDLSAAPANLKRVVLARANKILLMTTPILPAVRSCRTLISEIKTLRGGSEEEIEVVLNMQGFAPKGEVPKAQIEQGLGKKLSAVLPFDPETMVRIESESLKMHEDKGGESLIKKILPLVASLLRISESAASDQDNKKSGGIGNLLDKLKTKG